LRIGVSDRCTQLGGEKAVVIGKSPPKTAGQMDRETEWSAAYSEAHGCREVLADQSLRRQEAPLLTFDGALFDGMMLRTLSSEDSSTSVLTSTSSGERTGFCALIR
jgi:hypothetical protein